MSPYVDKQAAFQATLKYAKMGLLKRETHMPPQRDKHTAFQAMLKYAEIGLCKPEMSPHVEIKQAIYIKKPATPSFSSL